MKKIIIYIFISVFCCSNIIAQQIKKSTTGDFILKNATIHTVSSGIVNGDILISNGKIANVGQSLNKPTGATEIDCAGKHIYPGFIDSGTRLGLAEIGSISLTQDHRELGNITPHMKALTAVNPNSVSIPVTRVNGITTVITKPSGGTLPGTAALINLHGYTPDQMAAGFECIYMQMPSSGKRGWWDRRSEEEIKKEAEKAMKSLKDTWEQAKLYAQIDSARQKSDLPMVSYNPQLASLVPVLKREQQIMIEANKKSDILAAIEFINDYNFKAIISGASESWRVTDSLKKYDIPVIVGPVLSLPARGSDAYDTPYELASMLDKAGVRFAIRTNGDENTRNLPFEAGFAATYGLGTDKALRAITLSPAEIFGVSEMYGSIEEGKVANLIVSDGDPFEMKTRISHLFINGWNVPIESRHTLLYDEFIERSPGVKE